MLTLEERLAVLNLYEELGSYRAAAAVVGCDHKRRRFFSIQRFQVLARGLAACFEARQTGDQAQTNPRRRRVGDGVVEGASWRSPPQVD